jgi:hypothetical protein
MPTAEVHRTLVKSPPELWTELSDPASLARHLGEFGEIRVTRVEPETAVEWETESVSGSVQLKPSGWGTKVTFSVTRQLPEPPPAPEPQAAEPAAAEPEPVAVEPQTVAVERVAAEPEPVEPEPSAVEPEPLTAEHVQAAAEPAPVEPAQVATEPEPVENVDTADPEIAEPVPSRRGFFARLFRRRRAEQPAPEPVFEPETVIEPEAMTEPEAVAEHTVAEPEAIAEALAEPTATEPEAVADAVAEPEPAAKPEPIEPPAEEPPDLAAELAAMEQTMVEQDSALLSSVLDRLGAAHHRPFSRG